MRNISGLGNTGANTATPAIVPDIPPARRAIPEPSPVQPPPEPRDDSAAHSPEQHASSPLFDDHFSAGSRRLYLAAQDYLRELRANLLTGKEITLDRPLAIISQMITEPSLLDEMYQLTLAFQRSDDMCIASPINSMIYSSKIGIRMGYTPAKLSEICLAALHHDIGMFLIPETILKKEGRLTGSEVAIMKKHTETGRDVLTALGYPNVGRAIHEHHERENGQGYPCGLKGEQISEYAKIIGICDSYEAMTHDRPHKKAAAQYISVLQLAGSKDMLFSPHIVKIFLDEITLYPIGSYVRLNNKAIGVVVETNPGNPLKPTIQIVVDGHGRKATEKKLINLAENSILTIVAGVSADELPA
ncbi:MAG: HD-GYP domain-containing protein [Syntrophales bacterium]